MEKNNPNLSDQQKKVLFEELDSFLKPFNNEYRKIIKVL